MLVHRLELVRMAGTIGSATRAKLFARCAIVRRDSSLFIGVKPPMTDKTTGQSEFCNAPITADVELTASGSDVNASVQEACEETSRPKYCSTHASALHKSVWMAVVSWQFLAANHRSTDTRSGGGVYRLSMEKPIVEHPAFEWPRFDLTAFDANAKLFMTYGRGSRRSKTPQPRRRATMPECRESRVKGPEPDGKIVARQSSRGSVARGRCELVKELQNNSGDRD